MTYVFCTLLGVTLLRRREVVCSNTYVAIQSFVSMKKILIPLAIIIVLFIILKVLQSNNPPVEGETETLSSEAEENQVEESEAKPLSAEEIKTNEALVEAYVTANINTLVQTTPDTGSWSVSKVVFEPKTQMGQVFYTDGKKSRQAIFDYSVSADGTVGVTGFYDVMPQ